DGTTFSLIYPRQRNIPRCSSSGYGRDLSPSVFAIYFLRCGPMGRRFRSLLATFQLAARSKHAPSRAFRSLRSAIAFPFPWALGVQITTHCRCRVFNYLPHLKLGRSKLFPLPREDVRNTFLFFANGLRYRVAIHEAVTL